VVIGAVIGAILVAAPVSAEQARAVAPEGSGTAISVGSARDFSHIEFHGPVSIRRDGQKVIVSMGRPAADVSRLRVDPPQFLRSTDVQAQGGRQQIVLTLTDDGDARMGTADGVTFINLFKKADPPPPSAAPAAPPAPARPDPLPPSGVVVATANKVGPQATVVFPWKAPLGAAVFRRGDGIWVVFDTKARLDVSAAQRAMPQYRVQVVDGPDYSAIRIAAPDGIPYSAAGIGPNWTLIVGPGAQARSLQIAMARATEDGPATLAANVAGATKVIWMDDPVVGDRLAVVTALAPAKGVILRRAYVDLAALPSAQGLALTPSGDNLQISTDGDVVRITKPDGLNLSPPVRTRMAADAELPMPAIMPGLVNFDQWSHVAPGGFLERYNGLLNAVATETNRQVLGDKSAGLAARMGFARFLVGSELSYEAIGELNALAKSHSEMLANAEFRGLRGAARVMAGRYKEAQADFSAPPLADDPASSLWRGYADARLGQWTEARQEFQNGSKALPLFNAAWRTRFTRANAEASLRLNDFVTAHAQINYAMKQPQEPLEKLATVMVFARLMEAEGGGERALPIYDAIARAPTDQLAAPAILHATQIRLWAGRIAPEKAALTYNSLRFRWRGDSTELEVIRALGQLYLAQGRYREALDALRTARQRNSDLPESVQIQDDLSGAFRNLFLNGLADGMEPVQALGLFFDFKELTPIGGDGDEMVRKLAQRLVNVDLLDQAASLLKYQADSRLDGVPRAQVATDLAIIQLMGRRPEEALNALNASRNTLLPAALQQQRRLIEARAWLQFGQLDHADEILGSDQSVEAVSLRGEIAWKRRNWPLAGKIFEQNLGERWKATDGLALAPEEESKLLRAAVAYSLAQDDASLARLRDHFQGFVDKARWPEPLRVALSGVNVDQITTSNFAQAISDDQVFAGWAARMRQRFRERILGGPTPGLTLRPVVTAEAEPAAQPVAAPVAPKGKAKAPAKTTKS
jgi:tetratricopeptide (TPR) repeat protein